ncbi:MAG: carbohydrate binding domain-containing protein [Anaerolineae bacterium]|nr:carbohydrate binding domain-containing protein [Anaerolineae bacterium]
MDGDRSWQAADKKSRFSTLVLSVLLAMAVLFLVMLSVDQTRPLSAAALTPTPTPTALPQRVYDPPAPSDLVLPADRSQIATVDADGYPRIVKLWGGFEPGAGIDFYAQYDMMINQSAFNASQIDYLRSINPNLIVIYTGIGTYDSDTGPLGSQWITATGTWQFDCFLRDRFQQVLRVDEWGHGMFNMTNDTCTDAIVAYLVANLDTDVYDGVFFDRVYQLITPVLSGIDLDHDWHADSAETVNQQYYEGTQRFLAKVRAALDPLLGPDAVILANDAPLHYTSQLNGREYELTIRNILDGSKDWLRFYYNYEQWMQASLEPRLTMVMSNPPTWVREKYGLNPHQKIGGAMVGEFASYYRRMRFGLTTALLEGGTYSFEFGDTWHGNAWWYDEFDGAGLGKGYLGQPLGDAYFATGPLTTANVIQNPGFEEPDLSGWMLQTQVGAQAVLTSTPVTTTFTSTMSARITIVSSNQTDYVRLEQDGVPLLGGHAYTLSFWGKAPWPHWRVNARLHAPGNLGTTYGLDDMVELGTTWQQYWLPFTAGPTTENAVLSLGVGSGSPGEVWIDQVRLQEGILPNVLRRDFENGIVLCNGTRDRQTILLGGTYSKLDGAQAPLAKILVDDATASSTEFAKIGGWGIANAGYDDWGETYNYAVTTADPDGFQSKVVWRPTLPHTDDYTVFAWIAPHAGEGCTDTVTYTIRHAGGVSPVAVSQVVPAPAWVNLGTYPFTAGADNCVTLTNYTRAGRVIADVLKFESRARYNDGTEVSSVTLDGQDGIVLLDRQRVALDVVLSDLKPSVQDILTITLTVRRVQTETMQVRIENPNPAPLYLDILTPTITGGAFYSPTADSVVWEGLLEAMPVSITFQILVSGSTPSFYYPVHNVVAVSDLANPTPQPFKIVSTLFHIVNETHLTPRIFVPVVLKSHMP